LSPVIPHAYESLPVNEDVRVRRLHSVVTCAAFAMFAWLTARHVGQAAFVEDRVP
jgi:hypothetical protein